MIIQYIIYSIITLPFLLSPAASLKPTLELKEINGYTVPVQNGIPLYSPEKQPRDRIGLDGIWKKERIKVDHSLSLKERTPKTISLLEKESGARYLADYDDTPWKEHLVPGPENPPPDRYQGGVWYRKNFSIPAGYKDKFLRLHFEAVNYVADIWINGKWIGYHEGGYTPFSFDITPFIKPEENNIIAIRVDNIPWLPHSSGETPIYKGKDIVPYKTCDWWNYGGITKPVYIEICEAISIANVGINSSDSGVSFTVTIFNQPGEKVNLSAKVSLWEARTNHNNVLNPEPQAIIGREHLVGNTTKDISFKYGQKIKPINLRLKLKDAKLWFPENPNLYVVEISLWQGNTKRDTCYTQFGIRDIKIKASRLFLNNRPLYLNGIARHEVLNSSMKDLYDDLKIIKEMNVNFLRTGHYPNKPELYILTDRMGIITWEEIPVYWFDKDGFNNQAERGISKQMWLEMIYRDYNRPSIAFWGTCNECATQKERKRFLKELYKLAHTIDGSRLVTQSASGSDPLDMTHQICDLVGVTMYYGIFYGKEYYKDTLKAVEMMHAAFPEKPILVTEYGTWSGLDQSLAQKQVKVAEETLKALFEKPYVVGWTWWCAFDWYSMITTFQTMGAVTLKRDYIKPIYYLLQKSYGKKFSPLEAEIVSPHHYAILRGIVEIKNKVESSYKIEEVSFTIEGQSVDPFSYKWDTTQVSDGEYILFLKARDSKGITQTSIKKVFVDNIDDPPEVIVNIKDRDWLMHTKLLEIHLRDDRSPPMDLTASLTIDGTARELNKSGLAKFSYEWNVDNYPDKTDHKVLVTATDGKGNRSEESYTVTVDNSPGIYIHLPYNHDWTSWDENMSDGTGWDFPAEQLPHSNTDYFYNNEEHIKFIFGDKSDGKLNNLECNGQKLQVPSGKYESLYLLASSHDGSTSGELSVIYKDGSTETVTINISDWWGTMPMFGEEVAIKCPHHHERNARDNPPGVGIYLKKIELNPEKKLKAIILPKENRLHIFAMTVE